MRVTLPHMGNLCVGVRAALQALDVEVVVPPPSSKETLSLGVRYSPESVCLPFKLTLGNFIEALELGADTLLMLAGPGLCRFGYYARVQEQILKDLGYQFQMVNAELLQGQILDITRLFKQLSGGASLPRVLRAIAFGQAKIQTLDAIERRVHQVRAREQRKGTASAIYRESIAAVDAAGDRKALATAKAQHLAKLDAVPVIEGYEPLKVGVMGEFYVVLEPFSNMDVELELGKLGVEVHRTMFLSGSTNYSLLANAFRFSDEDHLHRAARPYLRRDVAGDGWESVGEVALHARDYDGIVHLAPFTCMPEIVARNIIPSIKADLPVLTLICDEQMGEAGQLTRLEALVDLLLRRRTRARSGRVSSC